jgi:hypothetical protein
MPNRSDIVSLLGQRLIRSPSLGLAHELENVMLNIRENLPFCRVRASQV